MSYGHVLDMISKIKENKALKNARHDRYQRVKDIHQKEFHCRPIPSKNKPAIPIKKLEAIKQSIRQQLLKQNRRETIVTLLVVVILAVAMVMLFRNGLLR